MRSYSKDTIDKIGNAAVYLCERISDMGKTKLLKLLYFIEEESVRRHNRPFFGIGFEVWRLGPVAKDVFIDLSNPLVMFEHYVEMSVSNSNTIFTAKSEFCDDEFSDSDISLMDYVVKSYGSKTARQLVDITHGKSSLWHKAAREHGLLELFDAEKTNNSNVEIDFSMLLNGCEAERYKDAKESFDAFESLKQ